MTLDECCTDLLAQVENFKAYWLAGAEAMPERFPMDMEDGEWFEQFMAHLTTVVPE